MRLRLWPLRIAFTLLTRVFYLKSYLTLTARFLHTSDLSSLYWLRYIAVAVLVFSTVELVEENGLCCKHK